MKYYVCSDIHSGYTEWMTALKENNWDENDPNSKIIVCGDLFDRLDESLAVYNFVLDMIKKDKIILVRGNHEILFTELCKRGYSLSHDYHNGTIKTLYDLTEDSWENAYEIGEKMMNKIFKHTINYFETKNYIFVHSTIPIKSNWRGATDQEWEKVMWNNPFVFWENISVDRWKKYFNKTIVFGHWHTSAYNSPDNQLSKTSNFEIAYGDKFIGLDACTAFSHKVNILIIEDEPIMSSK